MYRSTVRLRPPTLRRPMLKKPRGANSSCVARFTVRARSPAAAWFASTPPPYPIVVIGASSTVTSTSCRAAAAVPQLGDPDAPEQAERAERPLALVTVLAPERRARPQLHLVQDDARIGVRVADDQDVVDDRLRPFLDRERHVGARPVGSRTPA